ncbi:zinc finger protein 91-like [Phymastichus coffea]|uniref:zinc finger protein 91-like n=1 Tax=Phymastichus coffea TaxID=108790 RepID=UPI00273A8175|nr:zinc finger protein 91-like [Phymastichus coffea]
MTQSTITCYFKKEIHIDWDEADNCYGELFDNSNERYNPRVVLEKLPESLLQKHVNKNKVVPVNASLEIVEKCSRCKKTYKNKNSFLTHNYYCGKERDLQCDHCSYKTNQKTNLVIHISKSHLKGNERARETKHDYDCKFSRFCEKCKIISKALCPSKCERCCNKLLYQCKKCMKQFKTHSLAYYHWSTRCGVKGYFYCIKCDFKSVWRSKIIRHMIQTHQSSKSSAESEHIRWTALNHSDKKRESSLYQCPKCTKIMENSEALSWHIIFCGAKHRSENVDIEFEDVKDVQFKVQSELNKCSECGKIFDHIYSLNIHTRYCKKTKYITRINKDSDVEVVETDEDRLLKSSISADARYARIKEMVVKYCAKCQKETAIEEGWGIGRKALCHKCKSLLFFKCKKCLKKYVRYSSILLHLNAICYPQEEYQCTKCNYTASISNKVKEHYVSVHGTDNAKCKKCGSKFKSINYLKRHMRRCGVQPKFQCDDCPFKSKLKLYLRTHIFRSHMEPIVIDRGESIKMSRQRFSRSMIHLKAHCSKCEKEQSLSDRLKNCRTCKKTLCYKCKTCNNYYTCDDENACDHVKGYLETIKYECKRCGRGAISEKSLWMHEYKCGIKASFRCRFCKYASIFKGNTAKHEKVMHPLEIHVLDS